MDHFSVDITNELLAFIFRKFLFYFLI